MRKLMIIRRGECKRCGQCCDKSLAQPHYWHNEMKPTDDPDVRMAINKSTGESFKVQRICKSLGYVRTIAIPDYSENDEFGNPSLVPVDRPIECVCAVYKERKEVCRAFPAHPNDLMLIDGCGYYFTLEWRDVP